AAALPRPKAVGLISRGPPPENWPISVSPWEVVQGAERGVYVAVPIATRDRTFGVLYAVAGRLRFDVTECRLIVALSNQAYTFLERSRLADEAAALAAEREAERTRSMLFSSLSHNLKTPLASVTATLSSLQAGDVAWTTEGMRDSLALMAEAIQRLTVDLDNLLSLAQLEAGAWQPQRDWYEPREVVTMAVRHLPESEYSRVRIQADLELPLIWVDPLQVSQALRHVVENALEYSPAGSPIDISIKIAAPRCEIIVDDAGPGVPEGERQEIFSKFFRGQVARQHGGRGTGLGLAICKEILAAHGGWVAVSTSPQGGARFTLGLPLQGPAR
ncbi:MAG: GAF domain-containing sensor histidine kinase, partial [Candidatus Xenobia bacterium]